MTILRVQKRINPYVQIDRQTIQDISLSWSARGMLAYLLSMPVDWEIRISDLINRGKEGRDAVYSILKELKQTGYVVYFRPRMTNGRLAKAEYHVYETPQPQETPLSENPEMVGGIITSPLMDLPDMVIPDGENPDTYIVNNIQKKQKTKKTAAASQKRVKRVAEIKEPIAAVYLTAEDALINATLTVPQHNLVLEESLELTAFVPNTTLEQLAEQIQQTLLNPNAFKQAGIDFMHKLNSIKQVIRKRQWTPPAKHLIEQQLKQQTLNERRDREIREAQLQLSTAKSSLARWIDLEKHAYKKNNLNDVQHLKKMQSHAMQHIEKSQEDLRKIHEKYAILDKSQQTLTSAYASNEQKDFDNVA